ncbi:MAG: NTP transferase domain-containing protein [Henriciella sp.]|nr:NTP transferase domain-containing protein [Henriciella sp.]
MTAIDTKPTGSMKNRSNPTAIQTFILAGARAKGDALADGHGVPSKAHIKIAGRSMISRVLEALSGSQMTGEMTVIGLEGHQSLQAEENWPPVKTIAGALGPAASVCKALDESKDPASVLVTTCDHALLSPAIVDTFLDQSIAADADLTVALARRDTIEQAHPETSRTYLRFGDGEYSSCNLFFLATPAARQVVEFWQSAEQDRKRPWRIAWRFGIIPALRILVGRPSLAQVFAIVSQRLGVVIRPIVLPYGEAAIDVDTVEDLKLVEQIVLKQNA